MAAIEITVFTKEGGPLTKRVRLGSDGKVASDAPECKMARGRAERKRIEAFEQLAELIASLRSDQAIALGAIRPDQPDAVKITTKDQMNGHQVGVIARTADDIVYREGEPAFVLLDFDLKGITSEIKNQIERLGGFWNALVAVLPNLAKAGHVVRQSTSAGLKRTDTGEEFTGSGGLHVYIAIKDGKDAERFLKTLHERCWLNGLGWMWVNAAGNLLERSIVDRMVGASERLVFEGPPVVEPPLTQDQRRPRFVSGFIIDSLAACPDLDAAEKHFLSGLFKDAGRPLEAEARKVRSAYMATRFEKLVQKGMSETEARKTVELSYKHILLPDVELTLKDETIITVGDVLNDPKSFEGLDLYDPIEGLDDPDSRIAKIMIGKDSGVPFIYSFIHGGTTYKLRYEEEVEEETTERPTWGFIPEEELKQQQQAQQPLFIRVAQKLWGPSTSSHYVDYSFGNKVLNIRTGVWFDFDNNEGGTFRDLMRKASAKGATTTVEPPKLRWYGDADLNANIEWTIQDLIPKIGKGLISGQWGTYKTFVALYMAGSVMSGEPFIHFPIRRRGGVLFLAPEGGYTIGLRIRALVEHKYGDAKVPFAWLTFSPKLVEPDAVDEMVKLANEANAKMMAEDGVPLVLIFIDTIAVAAGYSSGEENDAATSQRVMSTMDGLAQRTSTFVFGVDHFGKDVETGTRGSSAKEAAADVVLATLGKKSVSGAVTDPRLAIRKRRTGENGEEIRFRVTKVDMGVDQYGGSLSSIVIEWLEGQAQPSSKDHWRANKGMVALRQALSIAIRDHAVDFQPRDHVASVRAVTQKQVREEFKLAYPASVDEDPRKRKATVKKAFERATDTARDSRLIGIEEAEEEVYIWEKPNEEPM